MKFIIQIWIIIVSFLAAFSLNAQNSLIINSKTPIDQIEHHTISNIDNDKLLAIEMDSRAPGRAPKFAKNISVNITPDNHGTWEELDADHMMWRLVISSIGARSLNLGFGNFYLPPSAEMILYADENNVVGPFTEKDNDDHNQIWTPIIEGDQTIIQLKISKKYIQQLRLELNYINHDFLGLNQLKSGACNVDVVCGINDGPEFVRIEKYRDIIQSVALMSFSGNTFCTGFLVNNTRNDKTPFFMTAAHCGVNSGNASSLVIYWNYQNSTCRPPGSGASGANGDGMFNQFNSGAIFRANYDPTDMTLVELDDPVNEDFDPFYAGWTRSESTPQDTAIAIHHPSLDEKRISFEDNPTYRGNWGSGDAQVPSGNHVVVPDWDMGTTEGGSSGSPLFNRNKHVVGQLHGGAAACGNNAYDSYGWFTLSWDGGGTPGTSLKTWLDPDNLDPLEIDGIGLNIILDVTPASQSLCNPESVEYDVEIPELFENPVDVDIPNLPAGVTAIFSENPVEPGNTLTVILDNTDVLGAGSYQFELTADDGDQNTTADLSLNVIQPIQDQVNLDEPGNNMTDLLVTPTLEWSILGVAGFKFDVELARDAQFQNVVQMATQLNETEFSTSVLDTDTDYFWRVRATNICGEGPWSDVFKFTTGSDICINTLSEDVPVVISSSGTPTVTSDLDYSESGTISNMNSIQLFIIHSYIGDLEVSLIGPDGERIRLIDRPGVPGSSYGCDESNINVTFSDDAPNSANDLDVTCNSGGEAIAGEFQPIDPLSSLIGKNAEGTWTLEVNDNVSEDGGQITFWSLDFCTESDNSLAVNVSPSPILICDSQAEDFEVMIGNGFDPSGAQIQAINVPSDITIDFDSPVVNPGETVSGQIMVQNLIPGNYTLDIEVNDGINQIIVPMLIELEETPNPSTLNMPLNGAMQVSVFPEFDWSQDDGNNEFTFELATDENFTNLIVSADLNTSSYEFSGTQLDNDQVYFWRVLTDNECATTISDVFSFTTGSSSSVNELDLDLLNIYPIPTASNIIVDFGKIINSEIKIELLSFSGQSIFNRDYNNFGSKIELDFGDFHSGIYILRIQSETMNLNKKVELINR